MSYIPNGQKEEVVFVLGVSATTYTQAESLPLSINPFFPPRQGQAHHRNPPPFFLFEAVSPPALLFRVTEKRRLKKNKNKGLCITINRTNRQTPMSSQSSFLLPLLHLPLTPLSLVSHAFLLIIINNNFNKVLLLELLFSTWMVFSILMRSRLMIFSLHSRTAGKPLFILHTHNSSL